jgi:hypothetical protein
VRLRAGGVDGTLAGPGVEGQVDAEACVPPGQGPLVAAETGRDSVWMVGRIFEGEGLVLVDVDLVAGGQAGCGGNCTTVQHDTEHGFRATLTYFLED